MAPGVQSRETFAPEEARLAQERELARLRADATSGAFAEAERWIAENPQYALGAGLALGLLVGWWIKR